MEWWDKMITPLCAVWSGISRRLGIRRNGLLKLRHDVRACEYEDVRIMWQMLERNKAGVGPSFVTSRKRPCWNIFEWAKRAPNLCHSF